VVVWLESPQEETAARLGVTVSSRVGDSVRRNLVKRRVREVFRHLHGELAPGQDVVVIAKSGAPELSSTETMVELALAFGSLPRVAEARS
jgi:ribonuclease P protein component